jgi:cytochrome c oxidase subunit 2
MSRVPKSRSRWVTLLAMAAAAMLLAACGAQEVPSAGEAPQTMFDPMGSHSREIYNLFFPIFWMAIGVFVVVEGVLIYSILHYRRRTSDGIPLQIHGNTPIEIAWTIIPALIVLFISVLTYRTQAIITQPPDENPLRVEVIGHQWWWEFRYPDYNNFATANELHLPADRDVELYLTSADVIHSFWVPRLAGKTDNMPGHVNRLVTRPLTEQSMLVRGQCAEFCGKAHALMGFYVAVESQSEFEAWAQQQMAEAPVPAGVQQGAAAPNQVAQAGQLDQAAPATQAEQPAQETPTTALQLESPEEAGVDATVAPHLEATAEAAEETAATAEATAEAETDVEPTTLEARGYQLFADKACIGCHAIRGYPGATSNRGPDLTHVGSRSHIVAGWLENTPENMERWLRDPDEVKPGNLMAAQIKRGTLTQDEIEALTAYLQSLK